VEKIALWTTSVMKNMPKINNHPVGENCPNLVTLVTHKRRQNESKHRKWVFFSSSVSVYFVAVNFRSKKF
jgi:hypothetical protein